MQEIRNQLPRFRVRNLIGLTALLAVLFAAVRLLGPQHSWTMFLVAYAFAPTIAISIFLSLRRQPLATRWLTSGMTLVVFALSMIFFCGVNYGKEAMTWALVGTLIEWPGQAAVLVCLYLLQRRPSKAVCESDPV